MINRLRAWWWNHRNPDYQGYITRRTAQVDAGRANHLVVRLMSTDKGRRALYRAWKRRERQAAVPRRKEPR